MTSNLKIVSLADVSTSVDYGYTASATDLNTGTKFLRITDIQNGVVDWESVPYCEIDQSLAPKYRLEPGDIVVARTGNSTGENYLFNGGPDSAFASYLIRFRIDQGVAVPGFVWRCMRSASWWSFINGAKTGSAQAGANAKVLGCFEFGLPTKRDQEAIAHILGTLDDKIELNRKTSDTLEAIAKALFRSWFVDFDPVKAKAEGRPTGLPDDISALFPDSFEDSELGDIPTGWEPVTLGSLADMDKGVSYKGEFLSESEGLPMLNLGCFGGEGIFRAEKVKFYNGDYREKHVVQAGDLLLANTDMTQNRVILGSPIVAEPWRGHSRFLFSHHVFALRLKPDSEYLVRFLYLSLLRPEFRQIAAGHATGTTVLALPKDGVTEFRVMLPGEPLLRVFAAQVRVLYERVALLRSESETLAAIRDTLLPKLISGELRVPDAEAAMEALAV